ANIVRIGKFVRVHQLVGNADCSSQPARLLNLRSGHAGTVRGHGDGLVTQGEESRLGHHSTVDTAAKRHRHRAQTAQYLEQAVALGEQIGSHDGGGGIRHRASFWRWVYPYSSMISE